MPFRFSKLREHDHDWSRWIVWFRKVGVRVWNNARKEKARRSGLTS
jgi:hypothetical protein